MRQTSDDDADCLQDTWQHAILGRVDSAIDPSGQDAGRIPNWLHVVIPPNSKQLPFRILVNLAQATQSSPSRRNFEAQGLGSMPEV